MLIVVAEIVAEAGAVDSVREAFAAMETETRKEPGCITYAFSVDVSDPTMLRITERWESMEAIEAHMKSPHMATFGAAVVGIAPKSMDIKLYEIAGERDLPS